MLTSTWRLIDTGPLDGPTNMAVDEALFLNFDPQKSLPVLRLYGWSPPALSLGRFQKGEEVLDLERCAAGNVTVVRRITGGGVIYHSEELTYSVVCAPHQIPPAATIKESFRVLASFLLGMYRRLGLNVCYAADEAPAGARLGERASFCFAGKEAFDILVEGRKIGGNAQRRLKGVIFQHGSIPLRNCVTTAVGFLRDKPSSLERQTASMDEVGVTMDAPLLKEHLIASFRESFGATLQEGTLARDELMAAERLRETKYTSDDWNSNGLTEG